MAFERRPLPPPRPPVGSSRGRGPPRGAPVRGRGTIPTRGQIPSRSRGAPIRGRGAPISGANRGVLPPRGRGDSRGRGDRGRGSSRGTPSIRGAPKSFENVPPTRKRPLDDAPTPQEIKKMKKEGMVIPQDFDEKRKRTVFVRDIPKAMEEELLVRFFSDKIGPNCVKEAKMVIDNHGSPMGCAYVEFANELLVPKALSLTLTRIFNTPIVIEQVDSDLLETTAEFKRRKARFELDTNKVFVGNLPRKMTEDHIRKLFTPFAPVDQVGFFKDSNGKFLGFASIVFSTLAGRKVTQEMNRFLLAGRNLHVDFEIEKVSALAKELVSNDISPEKILQLGETIDKYIDPHTFQMKADEDHETETAAEPEPAISTAGTSNCCVIHNCFDPEEEEPQEVIPDVQEEFEEIYGSVSHIAADMDNLGDVYVRFATAEGKEKCEQDFAKGKFVSGKKASCEEVSDMMYKVKFPHAKS